MSAASQQSPPPGQLVLYEDYSREDVHDLFDPSSRFVPQAGLWGLSGLIEVPGRPGDFVFLVTFGRSQGEHDFDEGISTEGLLRWQSQPHQELDDPRIQCLIRHDADRNVVHLFLRTAARRGRMIVPYTYLGRLRYDAYDQTRSRPVHFRWLLLDWPIPEAVCTRIQLQLENEFARVNPGGDVAHPPSEAGQSEHDALVEEPAPKATVGMPTNGETTPTFLAAHRRRPTEAETQALGLAGELLVLERERRRLRSAGRYDLAEAVLHTSKVEGDGAGFDIRSFFPDGRPKFIEVKTTTGPKDTDFIISANEVAFSRAHPDDYELCRVFYFKRGANRGRCYTISGDIAKWLRLSATEYRARVLAATAP